MEVLHIFKDFKKTHFYENSIQQLEKLEEIIERWTRNNPEYFPVAEIEEEIRTITSSKIKIVMIYSDFIRYYNEKTDHKIKSCMPKAYVADARRIELLKFLQVPRTRKEIKEEYLIQDRVLQEDIKQLNQGIEVNGIMVKTNIKPEHRTNTTRDNDLYHSTIHPVFLPFTLTEVFALTVGLNSMIEDNNPLKGVYEELANKIYTQLSDYAKQIVKNNDDQNKLHELDQEKFMFERDKMDKNLHHELMYAWKTGEPYEFILKDEKLGSRKAVGIFKGDLGNERIETDKEVILVPGDTIISIENFDKKYH